MSRSQELAERKTNIHRELEMIRAQNPEGLLRAEAIVSYAEENRDSALASRFVWDNEQAAHLQRLMTAREIVRSYYAIITDAPPHRFRAYVSLTSDRSRIGGGYRAVATVLNDMERRAQMVNDAWEQLKRIRAKYDGLTELAEVFAVIDKSMAKKA